MTKQKLILGMALFAVIVGTFVVVTIRQHQQATPTRQVSITLKTNLDHQWQEVAAHAAAYVFPVTVFRASDNYPYAWGTGYLMWLPEMHQVGRPNARAGTPFAVLPGQVERYMVTAQHGLEATPAGVSPTDKVIAAGDRILYQAPSMPVIFDPSEDLAFWRYDEEAPNGQGGHDLPATAPGPNGAMFPVFCPVLHGALQPATHTPYVGEQVLVLGYPYDARTKTYRETAALGTITVHGSGWEGASKAARLPAHYIRSWWNIKGLQVEGGDSGSPVLDASGQVLGTLIANDAKTGEARFVPWAGAGSPPSGQQ